MLYVVILATLLIAGIVGVSVIAVDNVTSVSNTATDSAKIDNLRNSEYIDAYFDGADIHLENRGRDTSEIAMIRFYDDKGDEVRIIHLPDGTDRVFGGDMPSTASTDLTYDDSQLLPHDPQIITVPIHNSTVSGEIITKYGNVIPIRNMHPDSLGDETGDGSNTNGTATVNGLGLNSRIAQKDFDGVIVTGSSNSVGDAHDVVPYLSIPRTTADSRPYVAIIGDTDPVTVHNIPTLDSRYELRDGYLHDRNAQNLLLFSNNTVVGGQNSFSIRSGYYEVTGNGTTIFKIDESLYGRILDLSGSVPSGSSLKIVTSEKNLNDGDIYQSLLGRDDPPQHEYGYYIGDMTCTDLVREGSYDFNYRRDLFRSIDQYDLKCLMDEVPISHPSNVYVYHEETFVKREYGSNCGSNPSLPGCFIGVNPRWQHGTITLSTITATPSHSDVPNALYIDLISEKNQTGVHMLSGMVVNMDDAFSQKCYPCTKYDIWNIDNRPETPSYHVFDDAVLADRTWEFGPAINEEFVFPITNSYIIIEPNGQTVRIRASNDSHSNGDFDSSVLSITNIDPSTPFRIMKDDKVMATGVSNRNGGIYTVSLNLDTDIGDKTDEGWKLHLYPESSVHRDLFDFVIFDPINDQKIQKTHTDDDERTVYVTHTYVRLPLVGGINVTDMRLLEDDGGNLMPLNLDYLNKYYDGNTIEVPIIPGYDSIDFYANGIHANIKYVDVLGRPEIMIAEPDSSHVSYIHPSRDIRSVETRVGTTAYAIATSAGTMHAIVSETLSGSATITNKYDLQKIPPPPPPPRRYDPLTGWVEVYVNGDLQKRTELGIDAFPDFTNSHDRSGRTVTVGVEYAYPTTFMQATVSVDVEPGDFVEFYLYGHIQGDIEEYVAPRGWRIVSESGESSAHVTLHSASILTGQ